MNNFFIDKLNISQVHINSDGSVLDSLKGYRDYRVDLQTGESQELSKFIGLEGSFSSYLSIRVGGGKVEVYGNPSRWRRLDNLFGFTTLDECIACYNLILQGLNLPVFTKCTCYMYYQNKDGSKQTKTADGAIIKHIDFTRNLAVGMGNERPYMKGLSTMSINRAISPFLYPDENTVEWYGKNVQKNGSTFRYVKVYNKTSDLLRHQRERLKGCQLSDFDYYDQLLQYTLTNGVIREEHSFKREYLLYHNLFAWGLFDESAFSDDLKVIETIRLKLSVSNMKFETISEQLLEQGICKSIQSANATAGYYNLWLHGQYFDKSKRQFREHRSRLLKLGIDINVKLDISRSPIRLKECQVIEVRPLSINDMPDWYRKPTLENVQHLKLVA